MQLNRREALKGLAALASARWAEEGYDPDEIERRDEIEGNAN